MRIIANMPPLVVRRAPSGRPCRGLLKVGQHVFACRLGAAGIAVTKREGDRATPAGNMKVLGGYFRRDRMLPPRTLVPLHHIEVGDAWCDDPASQLYNRPVKLPFARSHEKMLRTDRLYDVCLVLDWNMRPRRRNRGSAIFMHQTGEGDEPTLGCIALEPSVLRRLLPRLRKNTVVRIIA